MANFTLNKRARGAKPDPQGNVGEELNEKQRDIDEYLGALGAPKSAPVPQDTTGSEPLNPSAKYGDRPGEKRIDVSEMTKPLGALPKIYDEGGVVDSSSLPTMSNRVMPSLDTDATLSTKGRITSALGRIGSRSLHDQDNLIPEQERQALNASNAEAAEAASTDLPVMDDGGELIPDKRTKRVSENAPNVNDGDHQMAVLENGERVLTPQQNAQYEKDQHGFLPRMGTKTSVNTDDYEPISEIEEEQPASTGIPKMGSKRMVGGKLIPVYDDGGDVPASDGSIPIVDAARDGADRRMLEGADQNDLIKVGEGAIAHNQINKAEQRSLPKMTDEPSAPNPQDIDRDNKSASALPSMISAMPTMPTYRGEDLHGEAIPEKRVVRDTKQEMKDRMSGLYREQGLSQVDPELGRVPTMSDIASTQEGEAGYIKEHPLGSNGSAIPGIGGKILHGLQYAIPTEVRAGIPGTRDYLNREIAGAEKEQLLGTEIEQKQSQADLERAQARMAGQKSPADAFYLYALRGGKNGGPAINPDTNALYTPEEALQASKGEGTATDTMGIKRLMRENPDWSFEDAAQQWFKDKAGQRLTEKDRQVADYIAAHGMEDTPQNRDATRQALLKRDTEVKEETQWPWVQKKELFAQKITQANDVLRNANADATQRGLKADELQQTENARSTKVLNEISQAQQAVKSSDDEQLSASITPLLATLANVSIVGGVKRLNQAELARFMPQNGSLFRWAQSHVDQWLAGQIPTEYRQELGAMLTRMAASEMAEHLINTNSIDGTVRRGGQQPLVGPKGATGKNEPSKPQAPEEKNKKSQAQVYSPPQKEEIAQTGTYNNTKVYRLKNGDTVYADGSPVQ